MSPQQRHEQAPRRERDGEHADAAREAHREVDQLGSRQEIHGQPRFGAGDRVRVPLDGDLVDGVIRDALRCAPGWYLVAIPLDGRTVSLPYLDREIEPRPATDSGEALP